MGRVVQSHVVMELSQEAYDEIERASSWGPDGIMCLRLVLDQPSKWTVS